MEDFNLSRTSGNQSVNQSTNNSNNVFVAVMNWTTLIIGLPLTLAYIFAVLVMVKKGHVAPVYIFNLLLSDAVQLFCRIPMIVYGHNEFTVIALNLGLAASVGFMMCVSLERYLVISKPLWYRFRRNIKTSVVVCLIIWIFSVLYALIDHFIEETKTKSIISAVLSLLPLPLFIFCLVGTIKALSETCSVAADEKRRIISILVVVLLTYMLLFLPCTVFVLLEGAKENQTFSTVVQISIYLSPLADSVLYIFLRKTAVDQLLTSLCFCVTSENQESLSRNTLDDNTSTLQTAVWVPLMHKYCPS